MMDWGRTKSGLLVPRSKQRGMFAMGPAFFGGSAGGPPALASSMLMHFDGTNGSTTFTDESGKTWARMDGASTSQLDTSHSKFGTASLRGLNNNDSVSTASHADFLFGSGDFNVAVQVYSAGGATGHYQGIIVKDDTSFGSNRGWLLFGDVSTGNVNFSCFVGSTAFAVSDPNTCPVGVWTEYEAERYGSTLTLYKNGTAVSSTSISGALNTTGYVVCLGNLVTSGNVTGLPFVGWTDEVRIRKEAVRMGNFTAPTAAFTA